MQRLKNRFVYLDYSSSYPVDSSVIECMIPYMSEKTGNPSSLHNLGAEAREAVKDARSKVARLIGAPAKNLVFTSGATESNNLAIKGYINRNKDDGDHIITTKIEHISTLNICKYLSTKGFRVTYLPVDKFGKLNIEELEQAISKKTLLVTLGYANSEIGTIQPIREIAEITESHGIALHVDATAAVGKVEINIEKEEMNMLTLSSNDIYGPIGVGGLYLSQEVKIEPLIHGGGQESGLRSGGESVPIIMGFGKAAEIAQERIKEDSKEQTATRDRIIKEILNSIPESYLNGHPTERLPNNIHFRFTGIEGESLILKLNEKGIYASTGSACSSKTLEPSNVLLGIGLNEVEAHGSLLITLGRKTKDEDVKYLLETLPGVVEELRSISPLWNRKLDLGEWKRKMEEKHTHG